MSASPLDTVAAYFRSEGFERLTFNDANDQLRLRIAGDAVKMECMTIWKGGSLAFHVRFWLDTPITAMDAAIEYVARANSDLFAGYFTVNPTNGAATFTVPYDVSSHPPTDEVVATLWRYAIECSDALGAGLVRVASGAAEPRDALVTALTTLYEAVDDA